MISELEEWRQILDDWLDIYIDSMGTPRTKRTHSCGLCNSIHRSVDDRTMQKTMEIVLERYRVAGALAYWWPLTVEGAEMRIAVLRNIIKDLESNRKETTGCVNFSC